MTSETIASIMCDYVSSHASFGNLILLSKSVKEMVEPATTSVAKRLISEKYGHIVQHLQALGVWEALLEQLNVTPNDPPAIYNKFKDAKTRKNTIYSFVIQNTLKYDSFEQFHTIFKGIEAHTETSDCLCETYKRLLCFYADNKLRMSMRERVEYITHLVRFMDLFIQQSLAMPNPHECDNVVKNIKLLNAVIYKCDELTTEMRRFNETAYANNISIIEDIKPRAIQWKAQVMRHFMKGKPVFYGPRGGKYMIDKNGVKKYLPKFR